MPIVDLKETSLNKSATVAQLNLDYESISCRCRFVRGDDQAAPFDPPLGPVYSQLKPSAVGDPLDGRVAVRGTSLSSSSAAAITGPDGTVTRRATAARSDGCIRPGDACRFQFAYEASSEADGPTAS